MYGFGGGMRQSHGLTFTWHKAMLESKFIKTSNAVGRRTRQLNSPELK